MAENGKVLIVDDDAYVCATMDALLRGEAYKLSFASNGAEGLAKAAEVMPDVIILDVMMPEMDGFEACRRLKADPGTAHIPVLLVTALTERKERLKGIEAGANDYLNKPIDAQDLRLRVRNAIQAKKLYDQLQSSYEQLKQLENLRDNLTQMIVHDMRSYLAGISGFLQLLKMTAGEKLDERESSFLEKINQSNQLLTDMVVSLLDIHRLEMGQMPIRRSPCNVYDLARAAIEPLEGMLSQRQIILERAEKTVMIVCDIDLVRRVIANLVNNAIKYASQKCRIEIRYSTQENGATRIEVIDDGPGIPKVFHKKIFEKFGQVRSEQRTTGAGLGLTFCRLVVEAHGGQIGVESDEGKGSNFWFTIPQTV